ncbi:MAG: BamA/TamA family outer membrane protein [Saprospiraceae bacterium]|nr:BamA/TamA family outer membrane protein [Saprospiraceae bacterium]
MYRYPMLFIACYLTAWVFPLNGQSPRTPSTVRIVPEASRIMLEHQQLQPELSCSNLQNLAQEFGQIIGQLQLSGFLEAAVDSIFSSHPDSCSVALHLGSQYEIASLTLDSLPTAWRQDRILRQLQAQGTPQRMPEILPKILRRAADIGYPLASAQLNILELSSQTARLHLNFNSGPFIRMGAIQLPPNAGISADFLSRYLGLEPGSPYQHSKILDLTNNIEALGFISLQKDPQVAFDAATCLIELYPQASTQRNSFDFMIGVLPQANQGKLLLTTSLRAALNNTLGKGEAIRFNFERLRAQSQTLELSLNYPYLLKLPLATAFQFDLHKRDTTFLDVRGEVGFQYLIKGNNYLEIFWKQHRSSLIGIPGKTTLPENAAPDQLDLLRTGFGIGWSLQQLDYPFNPRKGYLLRFKGSAGTRSILPNARLQEAGFQQWFDNLERKSFQLELDLNMSFFIPLFRQSTLKASADAKWLINATGIYRNEQFRVGGSQNLRGFDEESWFATRYVLLSMEYRLLLDRNAYLAAFGDWAQLVDDSTLGYQVHYPLGLGAGIHFTTKAGRFQLSLAYGKTTDSNWDLSNPKVHFGYVSLF